MQNQKRFRFNKTVNRLAIDNIYIYICYFILETGRYHFLETNI